MTSHAPWRRRSTVALAVLLALGLLVPGQARSEEKEYVVGADDLLHIIVWDHKELEQELIVRPDGKISYPLAGELQAAGLTVPQLTRALTERLAKSVKDPNVSVIVKEIRSFRVYFVGRVAKPGVYPIKPGTPLLQALTLAGGVADGGDMTSVFIVRESTKIPVNLWTLIQNGDLSQNLMIQHGDTIVIPAGGELRNAVYVMGEVNKPGTYPQPEALSLLKLISLAGGFTKFAAPNRATLIRQNGEKKIQIKVNFNNIMSDSAAHEDLALRPGDVVVIPERLF